MQILFFDTETTGLPKNWKAPVEQLDNWPRLVQIAWQVYNSNGDLLEEHEYVIKPVGFTIPSEASAVHMITTEKALEIGLDLLTILKVFSSSVKSSNLMVAHNYNYDYNIMGSELLRNGLKNSLKDKEYICTMNASTEFCKIPGSYGYKWPKLEELYDILFGESFNAHNALDDIRATARCFWELEKNKIINVSIEDGSFNMENTYSSWEQQYFISLKRQFRKRDKNSSYLENEFGSAAFSYTNLGHTSWGNGIGIFPLSLYEEKSIRGEQRVEDVAFTGTFTDSYKSKTGNDHIEKYHYYNGELIYFKSYINGLVERATKILYGIVISDEKYKYDEGFEYENEDTLLHNLDNKDPDEILNFNNREWYYCPVKDSNDLNLTVLSYPIGNKFYKKYYYENQKLKNIVFENNSKKIYESSLIQKKADVKWCSNPYNLELENWQITDLIRSQNGLFQLKHTYYFTPIDLYKPVPYDGSNLKLYAEQQVLYICFTTSKQTKVYQKLKEYFKFSFPYVHNNEWTRNFYKASELEQRLNPAKGIIIDVDGGTYPYLKKNELIYYLNSLSGKTLLRHESYKIGLVNDYKEVEKKYVDEYSSFIKELENQIAPVVNYKVNFPYDDQGLGFWIDEDKDFLLWRSKYTNAKPGDYNYRGHLSKKEEEEWERSNSGGGFISPYN